MVYLILNSKMMHHQNIYVLYYNYMIVGFMDYHPSAVGGSLQS